MMKRNWNECIDALIPVKRGSNYKSIIFILYRTAAWALAEGFDKDTNEKLMLTQVPGDIWCHWATSLTQYYRRQSLFGDSIVNDPSHKSQSAPDRYPTMYHFCSRNVHTCAHFCFKMVHCGIWNWCTEGFMNLVYNAIMYDMIPGTYSRREFQQRFLLLTEDCETNTEIRTQVSNDIHAKYWDVCPNFNGIQSNRHWITSMDE